MIVFSTFLRSRRAEWPPGPSKCGNKPRKACDATPRQGAHDSAIFDERLFSGTRVETERMADRALQRDVASRKYVGVAGREKQVAFGGPRPDPRDGRQSADRIPRVEAAKVMQVQLVTATALDRASNVFCFGRERPAFRNISSPGREQSVRSQRVDQPNQAREDRIRAGAGNLLRDDNRDQAREAGFGQAQRHVSGDRADSRQSMDPSSRVRRARRKCR